MIKIDFTIRYLWTLLALGLTLHPQQLSAQSNKTTNYKRKKIPSTQRILHNFGKSTSPNLKKSPLSQIPPPTTIPIPQKKYRHNPPPKLKILGNKNFIEFIKPLKKRNWWKQGEILYALSADPQEGKKAIIWIFKNSRSIRAKLLAAQALALMGDDSTLPTLIKWAKKWFDQPNPLLAGALIAAGKKALPHIHRALKNWDKSKLIFAVKIAGIIGNIKTAQLLLSLLQKKPDTQLINAVWDSIKNLPPNTKIKLLNSLLKKRKFLLKLSAKDASELVRTAGNIIRPQSIPILIKLWDRYREKVAFLTRLFLIDLYQKFRKKCRWPEIKSNKNLNSWKNWWKNTEKYLILCPKPKELNKIPTKKPLETILYYKTMHPIFSYGWMPLYLLHYKNKTVTETKDKKQKKYWIVKLHSRELFHLLDIMRELKFISWPTRMGSTRKLTLIHNKKIKTVSIGMIRFLPFEQLEKRIISYSIRTNLSLGFEDFFLRLDEQDLTAEGKIGQWAYRKADQINPNICSKLPKQKWISPLQLYRTFRELTVRLPSRTRLSFFDLLGSNLRLGALLYGTSIQSRRTRDALVRSPLFKKFKLLGIGMIQLSTDKIEEMLFELKIQNKTTPKTQPYKKNITHNQKKFLSSFRKILKNKGIFFQKEKNINGKCIYLTLKIKDSYHLIKLLYQWTLKRTKDLIATVRINHSGEPDRDRYRLIVQLVVQPKNPKKTEKKVTHTHKIITPPTKKEITPIFQPIYR